MNDTEAKDQSTAAVALGRIIREARKSSGLTIAELASKLDRTREWLNRIELGYSEYGEYRPPSISDLKMIIDLIGGNLSLTDQEFLELGHKTQEEFDSLKLKTTVKKRKSFGKLTQTEVIIGEKQIVQSIIDIIKDQPPDSIIRNTGIKSVGNYLSVSEEWKNYRMALGDFLATNPNALFKRIEYAADSKQLLEAKAADEKVAGEREVQEVHNARLKFKKHNPLQLHVFIGQHEAILALPQVSGLAGSNIALLIRDKGFVEALRIWYDEVLWDAPGDSIVVDFQKFDESFQEIAKMCGLNLQ